MDIDSKKISPGFALLDCPQSMKIDTNNASMLGSISDYFLFLSNGWDLTSYLKTLSKVLKTLKFGSSVPVNSKEGNGGPCTVSSELCKFLCYLHPLYTAPLHLQSDPVFHLSTNVFCLLLQIKAYSGSIHL